MSERRSRFSAVAIVSAVAILASALGPVQALRSVGRSTAPALPISAALADYHPVSPARILDTQTGLGAPKALLGAYKTIAVLVAGVGGVPAQGAGTVVLNVGASGTAVPTPLTIWPTGKPRPKGATVDALSGITTQSLVTVSVGAGGTISIRNGQRGVRVFADVLGWFPVGSGMNSLPAVRLLDTRMGVGAPKAQLTAASTTVVTVAGRGGVPATGTGTAVLNIATSRPTGLTNITVWPTGDAMPTTPIISSLIPREERNLAFVPLSANGKISVFNSSGLIDATIDVIGWLPATAGYTPLVPSRFLDTTSGIGAPAAALPNNTTLSPTLGGSYGVPTAGVTAAVVNVHALNATTQADVATFTTGAAIPLSQLRIKKGEVEQNLILVPLDAAGKISLQVKTTKSGKVDVRADVVGYFSTPGTGTWRFVPDTLTLTATGQTQTAQLTEFAPDGSIVSVSPPAGVTSTTLGTAGTTTRIDQPNGVVQVTATSTVGSAVAKYLVPGQAEPIPLSIMNVRLVPGVQVVSRSNIFFPPIDLPDGVNPLTAGIPGISSAGIGPFTLQEVADRASLNTAYDFTTGPTQLKTLLPYVLRGPAPATGSTLLGSGGNNIFGKVVEPVGFPTLQRGGFSLILVNTGRLDDVYEQVDWSISEQNFIDAGFALAGPKSLNGSPVVAPANGAAVPKRTAFTKAIRSAIGANEATKLTTPRANAKSKLLDCTTELTTPFASISITPPNVQILPLFEPQVHYDATGHKQIDVKLGIKANANAAISGVLQPTVQLSGTCLLGTFARVNIPAAFLGPLAALLDFYGEADLNLKWSVKASGGPKAELGASCSAVASATGGFSYNEATGVSLLPLAPPSMSASCSGVARATSLTTNAASADATLGLIADLPFGIKFGGRVANFLGFITGVQQLGDVQFGSIDIGPQAHAHWDSNAQVVFAKDTASFVGIDIIATAAIKSPQLESFVQYLSAGLFHAPALTIDFPTVPVAALYRAVEPATQGYGGAGIDPTVSVNGTGQLAGSSDIVDVTVGDTINFSAPVQPKNIPIAPTPAISAGTAWIVNGASIDPFTLFSNTSASGTNVVGSGTVSQSDCDAIGATAKEVRLLADAPMFGLSTSGFAGGFQIRCTSPSIEWLPASLDLGNDINRLSDTVGLVPHHTKQVTWGLDQTGWPTWLKATPKLGQFDVQDTPAPITFTVDCSKVVPRGKVTYVVHAKTLVFFNPALTADLAVNADCRPEYIEFNPSTLSGTGHSSLDTFGVASGRWDFDPTTLAAAPRWLRIGGVAGGPIAVSPLTGTYLPNKVDQFNIGFTVASRPSTCRLQAARSHDLVVNTTYINGPQEDRGTATIKITQPLVLPDASKCGPGEIAGGRGDPHLYSFGGNFFDAQVLGEYTAFAPTPGNVGPTLQVRQEHWSGGPSIFAPTVTTAVALNTDGHTIEVYIRPNQEIRVDGAVVTLQDGVPVSIDDTVSITLATRSSYYFGSWTAVDIDSSEGSVSVNLLNAYLDVRATMPVGLPIAGMYGSPNGNKADDLTTKTGTVYSSALIQQHGTELYDFTDSWRITDPAQSLLGVRYPGFADANLPFNRAGLAPYRAQVQAQLSNITAVCDDGGGASSAAIDALAIEVAIGRPITQLASYTCRYSIRGNVQSPGGGPVAGVEITADAVGLEPCVATTNVDGDYSCDLTPAFSEITGPTPHTPITVTAQARWAGAPAVVSSGTYDFTSLAGFETSPSVATINLAIDPNALPRVVLAGSLIDNSGSVTTPTAITVVGYDASNALTVVLRDIVNPTANGDYAYVHALPHGTTHADVTLEVGPQSDWIVNHATPLVDGANAFTFDVDERVPRIDVSGTMTGTAGAPFASGAYFLIRAFDATNTPLLSTRRFFAPNPTDGSYSFSQDLPKAAVRATVTPEIGLAIDYKTTNIPNLVKGGNPVTINTTYDPPVLMLSGVVTTYGQRFNTSVSVPIKIFDANNNVLDYVNRFAFQNADATGHYSYTETLPVAADHVFVEAQVSYPVDFYSASLGSLHAGNNAMTLSFDHSPPKVTISGIAKANGAPTTDTVNFNLAEYDANNAVIRNISSFATPNASGVYSNTITMTSKTKRVAIDAYVDDQAQTVHIPDITGMVTAGVYNATANIDVTLYTATVHGTISSLGVPIANTNPAATITFFALDSNGQFIPNWYESHAVLTGNAGAYSLNVITIPQAARALYVATTLPAGSGKTVAVSEQFSITPGTANNHTFSPDTAEVVVHGKALSGGQPITDFSGGTGPTFDFSQQIPSGVNSFDVTSGLYVDSYDTKTGDYVIHFPLPANTTARFCTDELFIQCTQIASFNAGSHDVPFDFDVDLTTTLADLDLTITESGAPFSGNVAFDVVGTTFDPTHFGQYPPFAAGAPDHSTRQAANGQFAFNASVPATSRFVTVKVTPAGQSKSYSRTFERVPGGSTFSFDIDLGAPWFLLHDSLNTFQPCNTNTITRQVTLWAVPQGSGGQDYDVATQTWPSGTNLGTYLEIPDPVTGDVELNVQLPPGTEAVAEIIQVPSYYPNAFIGDPLSIRVFDTVAGQTYDVGTSSDVACPTDTPDPITINGTVTNNGSPIVDGSDVGVTVWAYNFDPNAFGQNPPYAESQGNAQYLVPTANGLWTISASVPSSTKFITIQVTPPGQAPYFRTFTRVVGLPDAYTFDIDTAAGWLDAHVDMHTDTPCVTNTAVREVTLWALPSDAHPDYDFANQTWPTGTLLGTFTVVPDPITGHYDLSVQLPAGTEAVGWIEGSSPLYPPNTFNSGYVTAIDVLPANRSTHTSTDSIPCPV